MDIVARYLQAVRFWLPKAQKHDIVAELSEDIHARIEDQETELGRKLNEAEIEAILKQRGRPVLVASRYLPQEYLIGPLLFPIYRFVLKIVLVCYLVPWLFVSIGMIGHSVHAWGSMSGSLWSTALVAVGAVTIVFAILERAQAKSRFLEEWDPRKLPRLRNSNLIPRSASSVELAANLGFLIWWAANMSSPVVLNHADLRISLSPLWRYFFWGFLCLALVNTALSAVNLMRPYWTVPRATVRLLSDGAGAALFCWLLKAHILAGIVAANVSSDRALQITDAVNLGMASILPVAIAVSAVIALVDGFRIARVKTARVQRPWEVTVITTLLLLLVNGAGGQI